MTMVHQIIKNTYLHFLCLDNCLFLLLISFLDGILCSCVLMQIEEQELGKGVQPMNCQGHCFIFANKIRSYTGQSSEGIFIDKYIVIFCLVSIRIIFIDQDWNQYIRIGQYYQLGTYINKGLLELFYHTEFLIKPSCCYLFVLQVFGCLPQTGHDFILHIFILASFSFYRTSNSYS